MKLADAAADFVEADRQIKRLEAQREAAKDRLIEHFRKSKRATYKDLVRYSCSMRTVLDQRKVKSHLGKQLSKFQKQITVESVSVL